MFYITTYALLTAVSVYFIRNANVRTERVNKQLRNYRAWLRQAESRADHLENAVEAAYKHIDRLEDRLAARSEAAERSDAHVCHDSCMFEPTDEILGAIDADNTIDTDLTIDEARLDVLSWSPQHAGDSTSYSCYTDSNCSCAYGDEDTSDDV